MEVRAITEQSIRNRIYGGAYLDAEYTLRDLYHRAQYGAGSIRGEKVPGYREEHGISAESRTETYVALKVLIDSWRWARVPFYLRSGKRLARRLSEIAVTFKQVPLSVFGRLGVQRLATNVLVLNVQPEEGIALTIEAKRPGPKQGNRRACLTNPCLSGKNPIDRKRKRGRRSCAAKQGRTEG